MSDDSNAESVAVTLARLETKVDVVIGQHSSQITDHEARLRIQEARKTVSPRDLWVGVTTGAGFAVAVIAIWRALFPTSAP
jgi:hypothetical protein